MSKMPAKKKSCFQITSVTQAQVAASSATDDTESLDDPDESRTEDVSSEIFDVSRADFEPEVCDRSSSEETLNSVGEPEASHIPQIGQLPSISGPPNGGFAFRNMGPAGFAIISQQALGTGAVTNQSPIAPAGVQQSAPAAGGGTGNVSTTTSQSAATSSITTTTTTTASCSSRFRVIKLDHGTGEPFRRGRWTCTEFYEKDTEGSVISRTVDSIRHPNATLDPGTDRDSGLGATGGSTVAQSGLSGLGPDSMVDAALHAATHMHPPESQQQQSYGVVQQQVISGAVTHDSYPSNKSVAAPVQQQVQGSTHPAVPQGLLPPGHNGLHQGVHIQKSPGMAPAPQAQPLVYHAQQPLPPPQQLRLGHHLLSQPTLMPASQADYGQQHLPATVTQTLPAANLSAGHAVGQGPSPVPTPAAGAPGEMAGAPGSVPLPAGQSASAAPGLARHPGGPAYGGAFVQQQHPAGPYAPAGPAPLAPQNALANVGVAGAPATLPAVPGASATTQNLPPSLLGQQSLAGSAGAPGLPTQGDEGRRKSDVLPQVPVVSGKNVTRPLIPESLQLATPVVNSLFGIPIQMDGDEDRNPSTAFYQAFQSGNRLRDSKTHSDSASGASVVAIDNKIEQAMDLVKSHLMYAVREEVEVLKEQIKELFERNNVLERENAVLKSLANSDQLSQLSVQPAPNSTGAPAQPVLSQAQAPQPQPQPQPPPQPTAPPPQPNVTSA